MKYYDKELIHKISYRPCTDEESEEWSKMCQRAYEAFIKASKMLPQNVVDICKNGFFHDAVIDSVSVKRRNETHYNKEVTEYDVVMGMELSDGEKAGFLIHRNSFGFNSSVILDSGTMFDAGRTYGYGEIYINGENEIAHNILLDDLSEINIRCKSLEWVEIGKQGFSQE